MRNSVNGVLRHQAPNLVLVAVAATLVAVGVAACAGPQVVFGDNNGSMSQSESPKAYSSAKAPRYTAAERAKLNALVARTSSVPTPVANPERH